jgi:DNA polymerase
MPHGIRFMTDGPFLFIQLPGGRRLAYAQPQIDSDPRYGRPQLTFMGSSQGRWCRGATFGGKLVENIVQATARDCLAVALLRLSDAGCEIAFHVHDEAIVDVPARMWKVEDIVKLVTQPIDWAPGLPLRADAYETRYYKKDD